MQIKLCFVLIFTLFFFYASSYSQQIVIVKNHKEQASIAISDTATRQIKEAAIFLQYYIERSTGALLPISAASKNLVIHIGVTSYVQKLHLNLQSLDEDGFIIKTTDKHNLVIAGKSDWGTEFGVYSFLEQYVGIEWLMPTEISTDILKHTDLIVPHINFRDQPVFISRQVSYYSSDTIMTKWVRLNCFRGRINFHHNLVNLLSPAQFGKTNPDFYPVLQSAREVPTGFRWQPNFSAPGIVDSASKNIIQFFHAHPGATSYSLGINDYTTFDQSPASLARRNGRKNFLGLEDVSDDYFAWVNQVVKKVLSVFPDKYFGLLAYNNVATPPSEKIGVNSHVVPFLTYERLRWADSSLKQQGHALNAAWENVSPLLGWYDYDYGLNYLLPRVWFHQMQNYLIWGSQHKVKYYYAELYPNWGEGPKAWVLGKLLWNPYQNVDSLLDQWYIHFAGQKAAPKLREYYTIWENFWTNDIFKTRWNTNKGQYLPFSNYDYLTSIPESYITQSDNLITQAYNVTITQDQKQRVLRLKEMWNLYKTATRICKNPPSGTTNAQLLKSSEEFNNILDTLEKDPLFNFTIKRIKTSLGIKE